MDRPTLFDINTWKELASDLIQQLETAVLSPCNTTVVLRERSSELIPPNEMREFYPLDTPSTSRLLYSLRVCSVPGSKCVWVGGYVLYYPFWDHM